MSKFKKGDRAFQYVYIVSASISLKWKDVTVLYAVHVPPTFKLRIYFLRRSSDLYRGQYDQFASASQREFELLVLDKQ